MKRLTKSDERGGYYSDFRGGKNEEINKLGKLEDLEEELGIDLITLFKAIEQGVYYKSGNEILYEDLLGFDEGISDGERYLTSGDGHFHFLRDYGKEWALTKEELQKTHEQK